MSKSFKAWGGFITTFAAASLLSSPVMATDGYFAHGFGARHKALAGAGAADGRDATSAALNPAGLVHVERDEFSMAVSGFSPRRKYSASGVSSAAPFVASGTVNSTKNWFAIPNMAYAHRTSNNPYIDVIAFSVVGNGGMNTQYPRSAGRGAGVFGFGQTGINLEQAIISLSFAKKIGSLSIGISPSVVRQQFRATGLDGFGLGGLSSAGPSGTIDRGNDVSWGYGLRYGIEWEATNNLRFGLTGSTRYKMQPFDKYAGLFAQKGDFDIPASIQIGVALDVMPNLTFMADYKHIWYGDIKSIANPSSNVVGCALAGGAPSGSPLCLGGANGAGFGWKDIDVIKFGVEWEATDMLTLRAGYSYNTSPLRSKDVTFNILAPATVQHHITAGAEIKFNNHWSLELEGMYAPEVSVSGPDLFTGFPLNPLAPPGPTNPIRNGTQTISMYQYEISAGIKYKF